MTAPRSLRKGVRKAAQSRWRSKPGSPKSHTQVVRNVAYALLVVALMAGAFVGARMIFDQRKPRDTLADGVGRVIYKLPDGVNCRRVLFDSVSGQIRESETSPCEDTKKSEPPRASRRSQYGFTWGGRQ
jgi:hypothetical protein